MEDINGIVDENMLRILAACGAVLPGLGTHCGQRKDLSLKPLPRGGRQVKNLVFQKKMDTS